MMYGIKAAKILSGAVFASFIVVSAASATTVTQTQILDSTGEDMTFVFGPLPSNNGAGGTLTIASGGSSGIEGIDLSGGFANENENFEVVFEGASLGFFSCGGPSGNGSTPIPGATDNSFNFNNCVFSLELTLSAAELTAALADGSITVGVLFGDEINFAGDGVDPFGDDDEVVVTLAYEAVPLPAALPLFATALGGLGFVGWRRKRKVAAQA